MPLHDSHAICGRPTIDPSPLRHIRSKGIVQFLNNGREFSLCPRVLCSRSVWFRLQPPLALIPPLPEGEGRGEGEGNELLSNAECYKSAAEQRLLVQCSPRNSAGVRRNVSDGSAAFMPLQRLHAKCSYAFHDVSNRPFSSLSSKLCLEERVGERRHVRKTHATSPSTVISDIH
jgi:hypothetical protein